MIAEDGTFICSDYSGHDLFIYGNVPKVKSNLILPGKYFIYVNPIFNEVANRKYDFKKVCVDVYC
jgi:hypothetical protein